MADYSDDIAAWLSVINLALEQLKNLAGWTREQSLEAARSLVAVDPPAPKFEPEAVPDAEP